MASVLKDDESYVTQLVAALSSVEVTDHEMEDMRLLYKSTNGIPYERIDSKNRPRGPTIQSSSTLGSKLRRALGRPARDYGMSIVGRSKGDDKWYMQDLFRTAIDRVRLFDTKHIVVDDLLVDEDFDPDSNALDEVLDDSTLNDTEREQLILARVGQGTFRAAVELVSPVCRVTGVSDNRFLRASHIKPWHFASNEERLDRNNGFMLSPHIDHLFDQGFISFEDDGTVLVSPALPETILTAWSLSFNRNTGKLNDSQARFMEYHRDNIFIRESE
jgi:hypothetical protein